jgi:Coenzyme PQQ synthesis protein D (PqqD)
MVGYATERSVPVMKITGEKNDSAERARISPNPEVVAKRLDDELVVVHLGTNLIYNLNRSAARLWELLESGLGLEEVKEQLIEEFDVPMEQLEQDISATLTSLVENQLIKLEK